MDEVTLLRIFTEVGADMGYRYIEARFRRSRDLRLQWQVHGVRISFGVPDYLDILPEGAMKDLARAAFKHVRSKASFKVPASVDTFLRSDTFRTLKQPVYISRDGHLIDSPTYNGISIQEIYQELVDLDLIDPTMPAPRMVWSTNPVAPWGVSARFDVIRLPVWLSHNAIPLDARAYLLYREMVRLDRDLDPDVDVEREMRTHPDHMRLGPLCEGLLLTVRSATRDRRDLDKMIQVYADTHL